MPTARSLITLALKEAGVLGVGQTALAEDVTDCLTLLQNMISQWQEKRWLVPALTEVTKAWNGEKSNTVGPGGYFNISRPSQVKAAWVVQSNTGSTPVSLPLARIMSFEDYAQIAVKELNSLPDHFFYDNAFAGGFGNLYVWPIGNSTYDIHILVATQLNFASTIDDGEISDGGTLYTDGIYVAVPLTGGLGTGATADITVTAGVVALLNINNGGQNYKVGDILSADNADLGGTGAGFEYTVNAVTSNLDSEIELPEAYFEAIYYNLTVRICSMYQMAVQMSTARLAKSSLNTIRTINTQIPRMNMPPMLQRGKAFNLFNADGY